MDGLLGKLKGLLGDEAAKWKRSATLLSGIPKTFKNNPRNLETVDAAFGLGGIVPGVGDYLSALEAKYRWDQGDKLGAGLAGLGALPLIPAIGGMFIGKGAKTWDVLKNAEAVKMEQAGVDPRTIWKETGNWKAPDGQWRQEIPDNTAMDRARAMGFDTDAYHSTLKEIERFAPTGKFMGHKGVSGVSLTDNKDMASRYLDRYSEYGWVNGKPNQQFSKNIMPLVINEGNVLDVAKSPFTSNGLLGAPLPDNYKNPMIQRGIDTLKTPDSISRKGAVKHSEAKNALRGKEIIVANPANIRSRFAAFNPAKRDSADLLASYLLPATFGGLLGANYLLSPDEGL